MERLHKALEATGLAGKEKKHPLDLNAAERRMTAVASLSVAEPELLLLDEPTRDFDARRQELFEAWLAERPGARAAARSGFSIVHDDGRRLIIRSATGAEMEALAELGFQCRLLSDTPAEVFPPRKAGPCAGARPATFAAPENNIMGGKARSLQEPGRADRSLCDAAQKLPRPARAARE